MLLQYFLSVNIRNNDYSSVCEEIDFSVIQYDVVICLRNIILLITMKQATQICDLVDGLNDVSTSIIVI